MLLRIWRALFGPRHCRTEATIHEVFRRRLKLSGHYEDGRRVLLIRLDGRSID